MNGHPRVAIIGTGGIAHVHVRLIRGLGGRASLPSADGRFRAPAFSVMRSPSMFQHVCCASGNKERTCGSGAMNLMRRK
jgi:hypothetical protein